MSRRASLLLRASVIWTVWIWVVLVRNMVVGNFGWAFKLLHIVLAIVSVAFAVVTWHITTTSRRFARQVERERNPRPDRLSPSQLAVGLLRVRLGKRGGTGSGSAGDAQSSSVSVPAPPGEGDTTG
jgi:uncharacterized membrane protein